MSKEGLDIIMDNFGEQLLSIIQNELKCKITAPFGRRYSDKEKEFATTLHFYSPKAYSYLKTIFTLPDESTIRKWATSLDCRPGFNADMLSFLKERLPSDPNLKNVVLMFDAMAIRSEYVYDAKRQCYVGGVDLGCVKIGVSEITLATEALVFMVVGLMGHWKQAIGYFLINKISANTQAQLVLEAITLLHDCGIHVRAVVCDGCHTNQATARTLGCNLDANDVVHFFPNPVTSHSIYFLLDACHLIKNVRNTLGDKKAISKGDN